MASKPVSSGPMTPSHGLIPAPPKPPADHRLKDLAGLKHRIDWRSDATRLAGGDLGCLPRDVAAAVERAAHARLVVRAASRLGISAVRLVIGLLALGNTRADRSAKRVVRSIFGASVPAVATALAARLGLTDDTGDGIAAGS